MNRWKIGVPAALALLIIAAIVVWTQRGGNAETIEVRRGDIDVTIETVGTIQQENATPIRARAGGTVETLGAVPGDTVDTGDILIQLDRTSFQQQIAQARQAVADAEFALQLAEQRANAEPDVQQRQIDLLDARSRAADARGALEDAKTALQQSAIRAPEAGIVLEFLVAPGDIASQAQPVARMYRKSDLIMVADVDELDLPNVNSGTEARFRLDAFPAEEIRGSIVRTAPEAREQGGATIFPATIEFNVPEDLDIRPGMNGTVTIVTDARTGVLLIPERAIRTVGERAFVTLLTPNDGREEREVLLGYHGDNNQVEVVSGLNEGDTLVIPD